LRKFGESFVARGVGHAIVTFLPQSPDNYFANRRIAQSMGICTQLDLEAIPIRE
jgi:hypothetical protein